MATICRVGIVHGGGEPAGGNGGEPYRSHLQGASGRTIVGGTRTVNYASTRGPMAAESIDEAEFQPGVIKSDPPTRLLMLIDVLRVRHTPL